MGILLRKVVIRNVLLILWVIIWAAIYSHVEQNDSSSSTRHHQALDYLRLDLKDKYNMSEMEVLTLISIVRDALSDTKPLWTFWNAVDFVFQSLTTIGFGYITPATPLGQIIFIPFVLIGIPLTMMAFQALGEVITRCINKMVVTVERKLLKKKAPKKVTLKTMIVVWIIAMALFLIGGVYGIFVDDWSFTESIYFNFVAFTTIGFGDYVPSKKFRGQNLTKGVEFWHISVVCIYNMIWFVLGLCLVSTILNCSVECFQLKSKKLNERLKSIKRNGPSLGGRMFLRRTVSKKISPRISHPTVVNERHVSSSVSE